MNPLPTCLLYSRDAQFTQRMKGFLTATASVRHFDDIEKLVGFLDRTSDLVLLYDVRGEGSRDALPQLVQTWPNTVVVAMGKLGTDPLHDIGHVSLYAVEDIDVDRHRLQALVARAIDHVALAHENRTLKTEAARAVAERLAPKPEVSRETHLLPSRRFPGALGHFDNVDKVLENLVEGVAGSFMVARAGIFCQTRDGQRYRLRAGLRCLEDSSQAEYDEQDPLVRWLKLNGYMVTRANLEHVRDPKSRKLLAEILDLLGAEVIVPLQARQWLLGWLFLGHRSTGLPFENSHLESLMIMAEHVSTMMENALLYEQVAVQKTLAETLLHSMPTSIVAVDNEGTIRWFNNAAQQVFDLAPDKVLNQRIETLGSRLTDMLRRALNNEIPEHPVEWVDAGSKRTLAVQTRRLMDRTNCLGAVALIQDVTIERMLEEKQEQIERTAFWTELAASMSHEVRNPLVAIKTFAQLLPERYDDQEFRKEFSKIVSDEVVRLEKIIEQINEFAHPRQLAFEPLDIREPIQKGLDSALQKHSEKGVWVDTAIAEELPPIVGDNAALAECFTHLIDNAIEALSSHDNPRIVLSAKPYQDGDVAAGVAISVQDNGGGIPAAIRNKVFSPFCTTKARGMGLGLPIVKRTIVDHDGRVCLESGDKGTCITIVLPADHKKKEKP